MADVWRYRFYQMQNGQPGFTSETHLFDLPLNDVQFSTRLGQVGSFSGNVQQSDPSVQAALSGQPPWALLCERTAIYVELNGELVWGGILQQARYQRSTHQVQIQGVDWWGYFAQCRIISWNSQYNAVDQLLVAADLINIAQGNASSPYASPTIPAGYSVGGNVGVQLGSVAQRALAGTYASGTPATVAWSETSFKQVGQAISDMGTSAIGFDWTIDVAYNSSGIPTKTFNLWFPRAGRTQQQQQTAGASITFNMGGTSAIDYIWTVGQTQMANVLYVAGSGVANQAIAAVAGNPNLLTEGWPVNENSYSYTDVVSQAMLDEMAVAVLNQVQYPVSQPELYYACGQDSDQPLGSYAIGDDVRLIIDPDDSYPGGYDSSGDNLGEQWWRIIQWTVNVNDEGKSYNDIVLGVPVIIPNT